MLTVLEKEYMTRMPNKIRRLRESIDKLVEVLEPIAKEIKEQKKNNYGKEETHT